MSVKFYEEILDENENVLGFMDKLTGEFLDLVQVTVPSGTKHFTPVDQEQYKLWREQSERQAKRRKNHGPLGRFVLSSCRSDQFEDLDPQTIARLIYVASYLGYDGLLHTTERSTMTLPEMMKLLNVSQATAYRFWDAVKDRYIRQNPDGTLSMVNVFSRKKQPGQRLTKLFIKGIRALYETDASHKHLGYIFFLIDSINIEYNVLCEDPLEENFENIKPLSIKDLCKRIGYDETKSNRLKQALESIRLNVAGEERKFCVFKQFEGNPKEYIFINPWVLYAGEQYEQVEAFASNFE